MRRTLLPLFLFLLATALHAATPPPTTVVASPPANGKITGPGLDCGAVCSSDQAPGSIVTLTAVPAGVYMFDAWDGSCAGQGNPCTLTLSGGANVSASFKLPYALWDGSALAPGMKVAIVSERGRFLGIGGCLVPGELIFRQTALDFSRNSVFVLTAVQPVTETLTIKTSRTETTSTFPSGWQVQMKSAVSQKEVFTAGNASAGYLAERVPGSTASQPNDEFLHFTRAYVSGCSITQISPASAIALEDSSYRYVRDVDCPISGGPNPLKKFDLYIVDPRY